MGFEKDSKDTTIRLLISARSRGSLDPKRRTTDVKLHKDVNFSTTNNLSDKALKISAADVSTQVQKSDFLLDANNVGSAKEVLSEVAELAESYWITHKNPLSRIEDQDHSSLLIMSRHANQVNSTTKRSDHNSQVGRAPRGPFVVIGHG